MEILSVQGGAFSEFYLKKLLPNETRLAARLDRPGAEREYRRVASLIREAQRDLRGSRQARVTRRGLLDPLARLLGWTLGEPSEVVTETGAEDAGVPLLADSKPVARVVVIPAESMLDLPPEGLHRRFAPSHSLVRVLEHEGLTWGFLLNAFELRLVRRSEGFVSSHLAFSLLDLANGTDEAHAAWNVLWGMLRGSAWHPAPAVVDEVVRLGREHQQDVGARLGSQAPLAVERLLQGALDHPSNREILAGFPNRRELLERLYPGALRFLYRLLFVLYAESRGLLPLDLPTYRDGYALTGANGLVHRALDPATDPRRNREADTGFYEGSLRALFALLRQGANLGPEGRIPAYGGGLFHDPQSTGGFPGFDSLRIGDTTIAAVVQLLTRVVSRSGLVSLSYRELDVEQLGSLYEGLLERKVDYVDEQTGPLWRIRLDGDEVLVNGSQREDLRTRRGETGYSAPELEDDDSGDDEGEPDDPGDEGENGGAEEDEPVSTGKKKPIRVLEPEENAPNPVPVGSVVLRAGAGRKQTGSYYTNRTFVEYLVRRAIDPMAQGKRPEEILQLKVCDPAMGSGHFLVGACRRLAEHLLAAWRVCVEEERERAIAAGRDPLTPELLLDAGVHPEVARVWQTKAPTGEEADLVACRLLVAGYCIYGVDKNLLAVELARVSMWLATAAADHPLTFLNHRLVCGDSLLGVTTDELLRPFTDKLSKLRKAPPLTGPADDGDLPFYFSQTDLQTHMRRAFHWLHEIERNEAERPGNFQDQQTAFLTMQQELEDFVDAHRLRIGRAFFDEGDPAWAPELFNHWLQEIHELGRPSEALHADAARAIGKGKSVGAFCWELAFPEVYFEPDPDTDGVRRRQRPGFDSVLGNPPWDKVRPFQKEFYGQFDPAIRDFQGQTLKRRVAQLAPPDSDPRRQWVAYNDLQTRLAYLLVRGGVYRHQVVEVNGEKTGGDPDLSKFFLERDHQLVRTDGRIGILLPAGLYALEGATGLRRMLLSETRVDSLYSFENAFERFFPGVDSRMKFTTLVVQRAGVDAQAFPAAFMLRDEMFLSLPDSERQARSVQITSDFIRRTNPAYLSIIEMRDERELEFVERIYREVPPLAKKLEGDGAWNVEFHRELHMTDDAWQFRRREWLIERGCEQNGSAFRAPDFEWYEQRSDRFTPGSRWIVPDGTRYRIQVDEPPEDLKRRRTRAVAVQCVRGFLLRTGSGDENEMPIVPGATYVPLYEGRMVHQFDHAAKAYIGGEGRGAKWRDLAFNEKALFPHFYIQEASAPVALRAGLCNVTGQTNERSMLTTAIPGGHLTGNSVPTARIDRGGHAPHLTWICFANSLVGDYLLRQKISTNLNYFYLETWPLLRPPLGSGACQCLSATAARLVSITPEIQLAEPALDLRERAAFRAEIDAIVADLYKLAPAEFGYILTTFPLLDRDQPPLPGDFYVRWNKKGQPKPEPRSYVTRDTALLAYFRKKGVAPPDDLAEWYRREVRIDMDDENCPFRMGEIRSLEARVEAARRRGAIAYIPSQKKRWDPNGPYQPISGTLGVEMQEVG
jgi:hypothetical protein